MPTSVHEHLLIDCTPLVLPVERMEATDKQQDNGNQLATPAGYASTWTTSSATRRTAPSLRATGAGQQRLLLDAPLQGVPGQHKLRAICRLLPTTSRQQSAPRRLDPHTEAPYPYTTTVPQPPAPPPTIPAPPLGHKHRHHRRVTHTAHTHHSTPDSRPPPPSATTTS